MKLKYIILLLFTFTVFETNAAVLTKLPDDISVGANPVYFYENTNDGTLHIFCAGIDLNNNNFYDQSTDEKSSWWVYKNNENDGVAQKVLEFNYFFTSPFHPSVTELNNKKAIVIPFSCTVIDGKFFSDSYTEVFDIESTKSISKAKFKNSEVVYSQLKAEYNITFTKTNSSDSIYFSNNISNESTFFDLDGKIEHFTTMTSENGSQLFAVIVQQKDSSLIALYELDAEYNFKFLFSKNVNSILFGEEKIDNFNSLDNKIYFSSKKKLNYHIAEINDKKNDFIDSIFFFKPIDYPTSKIYSLVPIEDTIQIASISSSDLLVLNLTTVMPEGQIEMHNTGFIVEYMQVIGNKLYTACNNHNEQQKGKVTIYTISNKNENDYNLVDKGFTGYNPISFYEFGEWLLYRQYNICLGIDNNFDGIISKEDGDLPPSVWELTIYGWASMLENASFKMNFDFPINTPLHTNISENGEIAIPSGNNIHVYDVDSNKITRIINSEFYISCVYNKSDYFVFGIRDHDKNKSYIKIESEKYGNIMEEVGKNIIDCVLYQNESDTGIVTLSEGDFGEPNSTINIIKFNESGIKSNINIPVGTGGISIAMNDEQTFAAIVMNGSHEVHLLNLITGQIDYTMPTGTKGFGGPRDADFYDKRIYVTTYSNKIEVFNLLTGDKLGHIIVDGSTEGLSVGRKKYTSDFFIAANNKYKNGEPNNKVLGFRIPTLTNIEPNQSSIQDVRVYPHPVNREFHIVSDDITGNYDLTIVNSTGITIATLEGYCEGDIELDAEDLGLAAGNYTAIINGTRFVRFVVIQ